MAWLGFQRVVVQYPLKQKDSYVFGKVLTIFLPAIPTKNKTAEKEGRTRFVCEITQKSKREIVNGLGWLMSFV